MYSRRQQRQLAAATGLVLAMAAGACSTSGSSSSSPSGGDCSSPGVSQKEIKVGFIYPDTGLVAATAQPARAGAEARIALANADGGVHGRQIVIDWRDDASSPDTNFTAAKDLVENAGVFGLIEASGTTANSADYLSQKEVPVTGLALEPVWSDHENMIAAVQPYAKGSTTTFGDYVRQAGGRQAFLVTYPGASAGDNITKKMTESLTSQGIPVVGQTEFVDGVSSPAKVAADFAKSGADVLTVVSTAATLGSVVAALRSSGTEFKLAFGPEGYDRSLLATYGSKIAGMGVYIYYTPFETQSPAIKEYEAAMNEYSPELADAHQIFAMHGFIGADLFLRGLDLAGACPTREGFIKGLRSAKYDAGGLLPAPVDLTRSQSNNCYVFMRVNSTGTAFESVPSDGGSNLQWCGKQITDQ
jgi:ABC-type branched-subunit amino acid transport system substrate-binding protein